MWYYSRRKTFLLLVRNDEMLWRLDAKGIFLVMSFYDVLLGYQGKEEGWKKFWHKLVSP